MIRNLSVLVVMVLSVIVASDKPSEGPLLSTFRGLQREAFLNSDGTYQFSFSLPQQERQEHRDADGKVTGYFAFVDNSGEKFALHFDADEEGFQPESDALPQAPEDTDDVQNAREEFLRFYEQTAKFLEELGSEEEEDSDSSSSSSSSSEEDYDYEEESDEDSSSEEDSDEDEEEEEEEEDDEEEEEAANRFAFNSQRKFNRRFRSKNTQQQVFSRTAAPTRQRENSLESSIFPQVPSFSGFGRRT